MAIPKKSIRRTFFRDLLGLIAFIIVTILAVWLIQSDRIRENLSQNQIHKVADQAVLVFNDIFKPIEQMLIIFQKWGKAGILRPSEVAELNAKFIPILSDSDQISSIMIANSEGVEYFLIHDGDTWLTRSTGSKNANERVFWQRWSHSGKLLDKWSKNQDYDPRKRPWFQGAMNSDAENRVFWTSVYRFYTLKGFGITASMKWQSKNQPSKTYVVALDIPLKSILKTITAFRAGESGKTFLCNTDGAVLTQDVNGVVEAQEDNPDSLFVPAQQLGSPIVSNAVDAWIIAGKPANKPVEFKSEGKTCWSVFRPPHLVGSRILIGVAVPESDFFGEAYTRQKSTIYIAVIILTVGILLAVLLVRKYSYQLKDLPVQKLDRNDFENQLISLAKGGESNFLEFKSTMRMNLKTGKTGKEIELAWLKSVVAYMNSAGGILLIGVDDDGNMNGIEADNFDNEDKCRLHFKNLVNQHIGLEFSKFITMDIASIDGKNIIVIECERSSQPVFLKTKQSEDFYIRSGPSSVKLSTSEVLNYLENRQ